MIVRLNQQSRQSSKTIRANRTAGATSFLIIVTGGFLLSWIGYHYLLQPVWIGRLPNIIGEILFLAEAASAITLVVLSAILMLRRQRENKRLKASSIEALYALSPADFELYVANLFRKKGYRVKVRGRSGDLGVDLEVSQAGGRYAIVQCKRYRHTIGPDIVRELFGTMIHELAHHAFLVTTAEISDAAREWAAQKPITLIDGRSLVQIASKLEPLSAK